MEMDTNDRDSWVHLLLGEQNFQRQQGFFPWWYRLTAPPDPGPAASLKQRDLARRSKILSALALFLVLVLLLVAYIAWTGPNKQIITTVYILYPTLFLCLLLNRRGQVNLAGICLITALVGGMYLTLITTALHGGISPNDKDILYLPFFGELFAAALLPTSAIFIVAGINVSFSIWVLNYAPHTPAFTSLLSTGYFSIMFRVLEIHFIVAAVMWIMAHAFLIALKRADRATELARLQHDLTEAANFKAQEKDKLDRSIAEIVLVHTQVANGQPGARVHLRGENVLWQIAVPLNNLLGRYQQARQEAGEREMYLHVLGQLVQEFPVIRERATASLHEQRLLYQEMVFSPSSHPL
ncbi:MAG: hypothetical protein ACRDHZ_14635 [Ktedonobacteraceae bacterium]